jgi:hypothetical protein
VQKLISELTRLYLPAGTLSPAALEQHLLGKTSPGATLATGDGQTRVIVIAFPKIAGGDAEQHWSLLCSVANALQTELGLPAPAVSISGANGYRLWLSLETPAPASAVRQFLELLRKAYFPDMQPVADAAIALADVPPCLNRHSGKWAAFIHPGLGASFAEESGLEMPPPFAGQAALLDGLHSIGEAQFKHAVAALQQAPAEPPAAPERAPVREGLLLKDATLEDIVRHLHARNIEPTFRHLIGN